MKVDDLLLHFRPRIVDQDRQGHAHHKGNVAGEDVQDQKGNDRNGKDHVK